VYRGRIPNTEVAARRGTRCILVRSLLTACAPAGFPQGTVPASAPGPGLLTELAAPAVMDLADVWGMDNAQNKVGVWTTSREIHFIFAHGARTSVSLPDDRMVVSIAPCLRKTHPCKDHTPSRCRGEQADVAVKVKAATAEGRAVLDMATKTLPNGFVDLWLPRNEKIDVTIAALGLTATQRIGTSDADFTCVTTMELHY